MAIRLTESQLRHIINDVIYEEKAYRSASLRRKRMNESKLGFGLNPGMAMAQSMGLVPSLFVMGSMVGIMGLVLKCGEPDPITADEAPGIVNSNISELIDSIDTICDSSIDPKHFVNVDGQCEILKANVDILKEINPASAQEIKNTCAEVASVIPGILEQLQSYGDSDPDLDPYDSIVKRNRGGHRYRQASTNRNSRGYGQRKEILNTRNYLGRLRQVCREVASGN